MDWLYAYYDRDGVLLYVGLAFNPGQRAEGHRRSSRWWRFVASVQVGLIPADKARHIERRFISIDKPLFNVQNAHYSPLPTVLYAARREAWDIVDDTLDAMSHGDGDIGELVRETLGDLVSGTRYYPPASRREAA